MLKLERSEVEGVTVVGLQEPLEIDISNCEALKSEFARVLGPEDRRVVVDATNVEFFDSAGMSALLSMQKQLAEREGQMVIAALNRSVEDVFRMIGFDMVFKTFPDVEQARRSFDD